MATVRIRHSVYKLPPGDKTLDWYAKGVTAMKARPIGDPLSWRYQAARHEYNRATDPFSKPTDVLPPHAEQAKFWTACQHGIAYFLPWHRLYLAMFERIIGKEISALGGPPDWGLPYFDYSEALTSNPHARQLPPAFRVVASSLHVAQRRASANAGSTFASAAEASNASLSSTPFMTPPASSSNGFGGRMGAAIHSGTFPGSLEGVPHGTMHNAIGGISPPGWMSSFDTAALDPIFWLHHANIDRLWEVWRHLNPAGAHPTTSAWLGHHFAFHDENGVAVSLKPSQTLDIVADLGYEYSPKIAIAAAIGGPAPGPGPAVAPVAPTPAASSPAAVPAMPPPSSPAVPVRSSRPALALTGRSSTAALLPDKAHRRSSTPLAITGTAPAHAQRSFLHIEDVTADHPAEPYEVYLNVPAGEDPHRHEELCAGLLPMFGVSEATQATSSHPGSGVTVTLDVTPVLAALGLPPDGGDDELHVTFVPHRDDPGSNQVVKATVGRISLYVE